MNTAASPPEPLTAVAGTVTAPFTERPATSPRAYCPAITSPRGFGSRTYTPT